MPRFLVELDLRKENEAFIMYEQAEHCAIASVGYERHLEFCSICEILGTVQMSARENHGFMSKQQRINNQNGSGRKSVRIHT